MTAAPPTVSLREYLEAPAPATIHVAYRDKTWPIEALEAGGYVATIEGVGTFKGRSPEAVQAAAIGALEDLAARWAGRKLEDLRAAYEAMRRRRDTAKKRAEQDRRESDRAAAALRACRLLNLLLWLLSSAPEPEAPRQRLAI